MGIESKGKSTCAHAIDEVRSHVGGPAASQNDGGLSMRSGENSEARFYQLLEGFHMYFFFTRGLDGEFVYVCNRITRLLGYSPDEFRAHWREYLGENLDNEEGTRRFETGDWSKETDRYEVELLHRQGHSIWLDIFKSPVLDEAGNVVAMDSVACDITKLKRQEEKMRFGQGRFREISESSPIGIFQIDSNDNYNYTNTHWQSITGRTLKETLGATWWLVLHEDDQKRVFAEWAKAETEDRELSIECRIRKPRGGIRWVHLRTKFFFHDSGKITFGTIEDITDRKEGEEQLARYAEELKRSNMALQDFAGIASHDLQEPLRKIITFADRLRSSCSHSLDDRGHDYLKRLEKATLRMKAFINDLLEFSRITTTATPFEVTDLGALVSEVLNDLETRIALSGGCVEVGELNAIDADPFQMRQLFLNLIGNALKFHKKGEKPVVKISARANREQGICEIVVEDNGVGFEEKYLERIFRPFERLHGRSDYEGSGMGLAICDKIVERHGGKISAQSKPGQGASFIITLPIKRKNQEQTSTHTA